MQATRVCRAAPRLTRRPPENRQTLLALAAVDEEPRAVALELGRVALDHGVPPLELRALGVALLRPVRGRPLVALRRVVVIRRGRAVPLCAIVVHRGHLTPTL